MKIEYVISGLTYFKIAMKQIHGNEPLIEDVSTVFRKFNEHYKDNKLSLLFNAFTEDDFQDIVPAYGADTYVDSGGLQIITQKTAVLNDDTKEGIYKVQTKGDFAMCFDEIPLYIDDSKKGASARTDMDGKVIIGDEVYDKGVATGVNIKNQIEAFKRLGSDTKVFVILQGNTPQDWLDFCDGIFSQIPTEYYDHIEGLSIADTCIGNGILEAADMISIIPKLNCPDVFKKRLHLLGVGSINRLIPILVMIEAGLLPEDTHISYDSTSISSSHAFGRYLSKGKTVKFGRVDEEHENLEIDEVIDDMFVNIEKLGWLDELHMPMSKEDMKKYIKRTTKQSFGDIFKDDIDHVQASQLHFGVLFYLLFILSQIINFMDKLNEITETRKTLETYVKRTPKLKLLVPLFEVETYEEYERWREFAVTHRIHSNRISRVQTQQEYKNLISPTVNEWL